MLRKMAIKMKMKRTQPNVFEQRKKLNALFIYRQQKEVILRKKETEMTTREKKSKTRHLTHRNRDSEENCSIS